MNIDSSSPCELILKIGCNESDEISTAVNTLLRSCSIDDQRFVFVERQIQPTTYFSSFTTYSSISKLPIQCQSLSCVIFLTDPILQQHEKKKDFFKSREIWNFHHKIELVDEYKQIIARQDYYELSSFLPTWSIADISSRKQPIIRFNIFTNNFDCMREFYQNLFQRKADSSKAGFVLFNLPSLTNSNVFFYQFSIKYSPSIESYSISQAAHFKFRLTHLHHIIRQYTRKVFLINQSEYYIYDPDGNLLHLCLNTSKENLSSKIFIHPTDSGFGDSSDPSAQLFHSRNIDNQSRSSNDSGRWSSRSSTRFKKEIAVRSAKKSEIDYRLKQQQQQQQQWKSSLYESEPRLSNKINYDNRYYSSMNNVQKLNQLRSKRTADTTDHDLSYNVDSPQIQPENLINPSSIGYLNAYLLKKQLIDQFEKSKTSRPKSVPLSEHLAKLPSKSNRSILQRSTPIPVTNSSQPRSKSVTFDWQKNETLTDPSNARINIGITLDSRLRRTPVLDMLRSTTMQLDHVEAQHLNRSNSARYSFIPIARF